MAEGSAEIGRYGPVAIAFHWTMALLVVFVGVLGLLHDSWSKATQSYWINFHAVAGLLLWSLGFARIFWRLTHRPPDFPPHVGEFARRWSHPVHVLLYVLLVIIPVFGVVTFIWHGRAFDFGLFQWNPGVAKNRAVFHPTEDIHGYLAYALFSLAGVHALAALWHHFVRHDGVLARMWRA